MHPYAQCNGFIFEGRPVAPVFFETCRKLYLHAFSWLWLQTRKKQPCRFSSWWKDSLLSATRIDLAELVYLYEPLVKELEISCHSIQSTCCQLLRLGGKSDVALSFSWIQNHPSSCHRSKICRDRRLVSM